MNIKEVARQAGVSVATISRVLNHPETVSLATRQHVNEIMRQLAYRPNWLARSLNLNKTGFIALLVPDILNPIYTQIAKGVEEVAHQKEYYVLLCNAEEDHKKEMAYIERLLDRKVDGMIVMGSQVNAAMMETLKGSGMPMVIIGKPHFEVNCSTVYSDYEKGAFEATHHLLENGYRRIAHIRSSVISIESEEKLKGYCRALAEYGLPPEPDLILEGCGSIESGYIAGKRCAMMMGQRPDAIFAGNDLMAFGAMDAIKSMGLVVPGDIAVVGFDNIRMASLVEPKLTTVNHPVYRMGLVAARLLFDELEAAHDKHATKPFETQHILLQSSLKIRKSCGQNDRIREIFG